MDEMVELYHKITSEVYYDVQDYEAGLGVTTERNNDIRYFADNELYPLGGSFYADYNYHRGQTTGIFHAPTGLSGLIWTITYHALSNTEGVDGPIILEPPKSTSRSTPSMTLSDNNLARPQMRVK